MAFRARSFDNLPRSLPTNADLACAIDKMVAVRIDATLLEATRGVLPSVTDEVVAAGYARVADRRDDLARELDRRWPAPRLLAVYPPRVRP